VTTLLERSRQLNTMAFACVLALTAPGLAAQTGRGIYVYPTPASERSGEYERALAAPGIDGVVVLLDWSDLTSNRKDVYDFRALDDGMLLAAKNHLAVELAIRAGRGIPDWMFAPPPSGLGLPRLDLVYSHHSGLGKCWPVPMPPPWSDEYLRAFDDMLNRVSQHLRQTGALSQVAVVKLTGMNGITEELRLPAQTTERTNGACLGDDVRIWLNAGYRPTRVQKAFRALVVSFKRAFPDVRFTLPVILGGEFPPIDERGQVLEKGPAHRVEQELLTSLVAIAASEMPNRFILQHNSLSDVEPADPRLVELARHAGVPVAWQTNLFLGNQHKGAGCGGAVREAVACDEGSFLTLLRHGITPEGGIGPNARGILIEVFPADALSFPHAIETAHRELTQ